MVKVYETQNSKIVDKITLTTNNQNAVSSRDLRSNDSLQLNLSKLFSAREYYYERKPREFQSLSGKEKQNVISNEKVGQAYLAVVEKKPALAMAQKAKIWSDFYEDIFCSDVQRLLAAYLVYIHCHRMNKQLSKITSTRGIRNAIAKYGHFHLARLIGYYEMGGDWKNCSNSRLTIFSNKLKKNPNSLRKSYNKALKVLVPIVKTLSGEDLSQIMNTFKSNSIEKKLDEHIFCE